MFVVWTGMFCLAKECLEIVRLCCRTILNETIQNCLVTKLFMTVAVISRFYCQVNC